jgi:hypothetical protein
MFTATDPMDTTPEERRSEVAAILAAGFLRLKCRPAAPPEPPEADMSSSGPPAAAPRAGRRPRRNPPESRRN